MTCQKSAGFSLLEIMIAITIMALFAVMLGPRLLTMLGGARDTKAKQELRVIKTAIEQYYADMNQLPQKLLDLYQKPSSPDVAKKWRRAYFDIETANIKEGQLCDPWDQPYQYRPTKDGKHLFTLFSLGDPEVPGKVSVWQD